MLEDENRLLISFVFVKLPMKRLPFRKLKSVKPFHSYTRLPDVALIIVRIVSKETAAASVEN